MNFELLLMVIIIIMLFMQFDMRHHNKIASAVAAATAPAKSSFLAHLLPGGGYDSREQFHNNPEVVANNELNDFLNVCSSNIGAKAKCCDDPCGDDLEYAVHEYGGPGLGYNDWAKAQAISPQVLKNHGEFVEDRLEYSKSNNITGRTYSPDTEVNYNEIPWQGIRGRPQAVKVCNPSQLAEANQNCYASKPRISWDSS